MKTSINSGVDGALLPYTLIYFNAFSLAHVDTSKSYRRRRAFYPRCDNPATFSFRNKCVAETIPGIRGRFLTGVLGAGRCEVVPWRIGRNWRRRATIKAAGLGKNRALSQRFRRPYKPIGPSSRMGIAERGLTVPAYLGRFGNISTPPYYLTVFDLTTGRRLEMTVITTAVGIL